MSTTESATDTSADNLSSTPMRLLFSGLVDDAAVFPPGLAPLDVAVSQHHAHRRVWYADMVGPLLCPADRVGDMLEHVRRAAAVEPTAVTLVAPSVAAAVEAAYVLDSSVELAAIELPLPSPGGSAAPAKELDRLAAWALEHRPDRPPALWVEISRGGDVPASLSLLANRVGAKLRVGGTTSQAFPDERELAVFLGSATELGVQFKLTAGLHHAVRHTDPATGFEHHGFLNVICAVHAATSPAPGRRPADGTDLVGILAERDAAPLVHIVRGMDAEDARRVRSGFASFGCCGVTDPVDDLISLNLIAHPRT